MVAKYKSVDADQNKDIVELQLDMVALQKDITYTKEKVNSIDHKLDTFIHSADKKYASKAFENRFYWAVGVVFTALISGLIYWIFKI